MSVMHALQEKWFLISQRRVGVKRLFILSDQWLTVCDWKKGALSSLGRFPQGDKKSISSFVEFLQQEDKKTPAYILVDVIEEALRREKIPPLRGADRREVLERRLGRLFPGTLLRRAVSQGRDQEGGEWILFSGLAKPDLVDPWLSALQQEQYPLAGIWSLQLLSRALLRTLDSRAENALLVGLHSGGLRQTFFHRGRTLISRLTPVAGRTLVALPAFFREEVLKTRGYLNSLRLLPAGGTIELFVLAQGELLARLADWPREQQDGYRTHLVDAAALGGKIGLCEGLVAGELERLHAHLLLQHPQPNHYAAVDALYYHKKRSKRTRKEGRLQTGGGPSSSEPQVQAVVDRPVRRLGDLLVERAIISTDQLQTALIEQKRSGDPLGRVLVALGFLSEAVMRDLLAESLSQESIDLREVLPHQEVLDLVPKIFAKRHGILPVLLKPDARVLVVAMSNPLNVAVLDKLQAILETTHLAGVSVKPMLAGEGEIITAIDRFYGFELSVEGILREMETGEVDMESLLQEADKVGQVMSHPMVRLVNALLTDAIRRQASDIHISPASGSVRIRFRIDGILHPIYSLHQHFMASLLVRIKVMAGMNIAESRIPQDGRISFFYSGRVVNFRVSGHPTINGENIVLRVLDMRDEMSSPGSLGLSNEALWRLLKALKRTTGLVLVTGPTGSGKTTTLYSILNYLNRGDVNVMTLEDPVEYPMPTVLQTHVNRSVGLDYSAGIRSMLWQDPDVILVGEVHDQETATMALQAAMTGHQVFATLHASTAIAALPRLLNLGVARDFIAEQVSAILGQRLVRRLCPVCRMSVLADMSEKALLGLLPEEEAPMICHAVGCPDCLDSGYKGRFPVAEVLVLDEAFGDLVHRGASREQLHALADAQGFRSLVEDARSWVLAGETSLNEVTRVLDLVPSTQS